MARLTCHLLVEAAQWDGPQQDGGVEAEAAQEAGALQTDVAAAHAEGAARRPGQSEQVVAGDTQLGAGELRVPADGQPRADSITGTGDR